MSTNVKTKKEIKRDISVERMLKIYECLKIRTLKYYSIILRIVYK